MPPDTLVEGYSFFVSDSDGTVGSTGGYYYRDTRYLSELSVSLSGGSLVFMGGTLHGPRRRTLTFASGTADINEIEDTPVAKHAGLVLQREQSVDEETGYSETVTLRNHTCERIETDLVIRFDADFADLFEIRGVESGVVRDVRSRVERSAVRKGYRYERGDGQAVDRRASVQFDTEPDDLTETTARFSLDVPPQEEAERSFFVGSDTARDRGHSAEDRWSGGDGRTDPVTFPTVETGSDPTDDVFARAASDLAALTTTTEHGPVPLAGTPWFVTPFGRDAILTAVQTLSVAPKLAEGTLRFFAAHQGQSVDETTEEEPGKIFHELRQGELADRGIVPHDPYFGTADATPLWVLLLAETARWQGEAIVAELTGSLADAVEWIYRESEAGDDPFVTYDTDRGALTHKGWKDTADSIRFADGTVVQGELAVADVQGYAAAALQRGTALLDGFDHDVDTARPVADYCEQGEAIETAFDEEFYLPERSFYALARTSDGEVVDAVASNVGHCLWTGTIPERRADEVVETLVDGPLASRWGLRTMSPEDAGYSPVSYHAGGIWPHDTSIVALGLAEYGYGAAAERLAAGVFEAATRFDHDRLPEVYCGVGEDVDPVPYPAACTPQAWAAGAPFAFLRAAVGAEPTENGVVATRSSNLFDDDLVGVFGYGTSESISGSMTSEH